MKPKVFFYTALLSRTGGGQHAMTLLAETLAARGYEVTFFTRPPFDSAHRYVRRLKQAGISIQVLPRFEELPIWKMAAALFRVFFVIPYALMRRRSLSFSWHAAGSIFLTYLAGLERRSVRSKLRSSLASDRATVLHVWGPAALTPLLLEWANDQAVPAVYHEMGEADDTYIRTWSLESTVESINNADMVVCCSGSVAENVRNVYGYTGKVETIPFMVEDPGDSWAIVERIGSEVVIGAIGRLVPHKRHRDLIQAVKQLRDQNLAVALIIAGEGPYRRSLEEFTAQLGIQDSVTFTGEFGRLEDVMATFDIFSMVSSSESQCMPITESMAYGKPVVASRFGGIPDFVEDGITGYLVEVGDVGSLAQRLKELVERPDLREEMGRRGRRRYLERHTPAAIADAVERVYESLLAGRRAAGLRIGYAVECFPTFVVNEILALRDNGAFVTVFNGFRPPVEIDPAAEKLRRASLYFPDKYKGVATANLLSFLQRPLEYLRLAIFLKQQRESLRLLILGAYYARIVRRSRIRHMHATFGTRTTTLAYATASLAGIDYSFTTHAYDVFLPNPSLVWKTERARFMRTISTFNKHFIEDSYRGIDGSKILVNYLGVNPAVFTPSMYKRPRKVCRLLSVGDLIHEKGHLYLIRACGLLTERGLDIECNIVGKGPLEALLEDEIAALNLKGKVNLLGKVTHQEVKHRLSRSDIFVLACADSRKLGYHVDGIPVALMEAMACGLPVISTNVSGIPELIEHGSSGMLVSEKSDIELADALQNLIEDARLREAIGCNARRRIESHFNLEENTLKLAELFRHAPEPAGVKADTRQMPEEALHVVSK